MAHDHFVGSESSPGNRRSRSRKSYRSHCSLCVPRVLGVAEPGTKERSSHMEVFGEEWSHRSHRFARARAEGWFDALMYYAYKDLRTEQAWTTWERTKRTDISHTAAHDAGRWNNETSGSLLHAPAWPFRNRKGSRRSRLLGNSRSADALNKAGLPNRGKRERSHSGSSVSKPRPATR